MKKSPLKVFIIVSMAIVVLSFVFAVHEYLEIRGPGVVVLLYHRISKSSGNKYVLSTEMFSKQLNYLKEHNYKTITPKDLLSHNVRINAKKTVILSFDDGTIDHYTTVYPLLKKNGFKGVFFIVTKYIGSPGNLTAQQIKEMADNGMEIGSHSYSHPFLDELDSKKIYYELSRSKKDLEKIIKEPVLCFAPPGGWFDDRCIKIARDLGYKKLFGCEIGVNDTRRSNFVLRRIEILGDMSMADFTQVLQRHNLFLLSYKLEQSTKFLVHRLLGSKNYKKLHKLF